jgi:hypothetical protein
MNTADGIVVCEDTLPLFQDEGDKIEINDQIIEELRRGSEFVRAPTPAEKIEDLARELLLSGYGVTEAWRVARAFYEEGV